MKVLITGTSGFIGRRLVQRLQESHAVICFSRKRGDIAGSQFVEGSFADNDDLHRLDDVEFDVVVHLAAVTGGCSEEDATLVNILGTQRLLRYVIDRGCRKFVLASSIAASGALDEHFVPQQVPIPSDHPCLAKDAYGLSKWLMEEVARYLARQCADADFVSLRFGAVCNDETYKPKLVDTSELKWPFLQLGNVMCSDVLQSVKLAVEAASSPGARTYNVVAPDVCCREPVAQTLAQALGEQTRQFDLFYYELPGNEYAPVFEIDTIRNNLGYDPKMSVRP